jgi:hypothetical protein
MREHAETSKIQKLIVERDIFIVLIWCKKIWMTMQFYLKFNCSDHITWNFESSSVCLLTLKVEEAMIFWCKDVRAFIGLSVLNYLVKGCFSAIGLSLVTKPIANWILQTFWKVRERKKERKFCFGKRQGVVSTLELPLQVVFCATGCVA